MGNVIYNNAVYKEEIGDCDSCDLYNACGSDEADVNNDITCGGMTNYKKDFILTRIFKLKVIFGNELSKEKNE